MTFQYLKVENAHGILWLTLHHPATRNALSPDMVSELAGVITQAKQDTALRAIAIRGANGFFSAGGNVGSFQSRLQDNTNNPETTDPVVSRNRAFGRVLQTLVTLPMPVVAVVEGAAMGGGMGLACCADVVLATQAARFALTETGLGLIPAQIAPFVQARVGRRMALRLGLTGERVSGDAAMQLGLVDALAPDSASLDALQAEWLNRILACAPQANRELKAMLQAPMPTHLGDARMDVWLDDAALRFAHCMRQEGAQGVAAFRERRDPPWRQQVQANDVARWHGRHSTAPESNTNQ